MVSDVGFRGVFGAGVPGRGPRGHVVLVGLMASGKTSVGGALAERLGRRFLDNDDMLLRRTGSTARSIAAASGSGELHHLEAEVLLEALDGDEPAVIAAAAAAVLEPTAARSLRAHTVVYLRADPAVLAHRVAGGDAHRPFVDRDAADVLRAQFDARDAAYRELASIVVDEGNLSVDAVADEITAQLVRA